MIEEEPFGHVEIALGNLFAVAVTIGVVEADAGQTGFGGGTNSAAILAEARLLLLDAVVDGKSLRLQIDTGYNAILVYGGRLRSSPSEGLDSRNSAFGIPLKARASYIRELKIGTWRAKGITAYVTDEAPSGDPGFDGLLGPAALGVRLLAFDFENHIVAWQ